MSAYEAARWSELVAHWHKKANRKQLVPAPIRRAAARAGDAAGEFAKRAGTAISDRTPQVVKDKLGDAGDAILEPTVEAAGHLIELVNDWIVELIDPDKVVAFHQKRGRDVNAIADIRTLDLKEADELVHGMTLRWRTLGAAEGAGLGALALVPVAGGAAAITLDILLMQMLATAIATRVCYAYGLDPKDPEAKEVLGRMVKRTFGKQVAKAGISRDANYAMQAVKDRVRWSDKLRNDHRIVQALEKLMKTWNKGNLVPIRQVAKGIPVVALITTTGTNAWVMGDVAKQSRFYGQTLFLADKYGLQLPASLSDLTEGSDEGDEGHEGDDQTGTSAS